MRARSRVAALCLLLGSAFSADAADFSVRPAYAQPVPGRSFWTGFYVGGFLGGSIGEQKFTEHGAHQFFAPSGTGGATLLSPTSDTETLFGFDHREIALTGGGFAGYQYQFGWMVIGAEADAAAKNLDSSGTAAVVANATYTGNSPGQTESAGRSEFFNGTVRQNWDASARLRAGWLLTPSILLYGTGGVALGSIDSAFNYSATTVYDQNGNPPITHTTFGAASWNELRIGWTAGAGLETALGPNWKFRAEYRFTDFGQSTKDISLLRASSSSALPNTGSSAAAADVSASFHTLRLGVAYSF